eukprot:TRINITY_DN27872_c0_g1_i1.p2 TRINITY_DN27872_c0_g1~~TRINITY_DN27872_c0_g1_i1.p2  ORF type:complete len:218 (-),score=39.88 TRINITY_DN27872_c0_g1_i1:325-912(-)
MGHVPSCVPDDTCCAQRSGYGDNLVEVCSNVDEVSGQTTVIAHIPMDDAPSPIRNRGFQAMKLGVGLDKAALSGAMDDESSTGEPAETDDDDNWFGCRAVDRRQDLAHELVAQDSILEAKQLDEAEFLDNQRSQSKLLPPPPRLTGTREIAHFEQDENTAVDARLHAMRKAAGQQTNADRMVEMRHSLESLRIDL